MLANISQSSPKIFDLKNKKKKSNFDVAKLDLKQFVSESKSTISAICLLNDGRLVTASFDRTIKVYNFSSERPEMMLKGHTGGVTDIFILNNGNLISSSLHGEIKQWKINKRTYKCVSSSKEHSSSVNRVDEMSDGLICSCSDDKTLKVFKLEDSSFSCLHTLKGHSDWVRTMLILKDKSTIVSCGAGHDKTIRFWKTTNFKCEKIMENFWFQAKYSIIEISNNRIMIGQSRLIVVINVAVFQVETTVVNEKFGGVSCFGKIDENDIIFSSNNGTLFDLHVKQFKIVASKETLDAEEINSFVIDSGKIFFSSDHKIFIWIFA